MHLTRPRADLLFPIAFTGFLCIQFLITGAAVSQGWFYGLALPAFLYDGWRHRTHLMQIIQHPITQLFLLFFGFAAIHSLWFDDASKTIRNALASALFLLMAIHYFSQDVTRLRRALAWIGLACGIGSAISIALYIAQPPEDPRMIPLGRAETQVLAAFVYTMGAFIATAALRHTSNQRLKMVLATSAVLALGVVILTQSRMALAVCLLGLALGALIYSHHKTRIALLAVGGLTTIILVSAWALHLNPVEYVQSLIDRGDAYRLSLWQTTWQKILEHPWAGSGMMATIDHPITASPHHLFLSTAMSLGFPGLALLLLAFGMLGICLLRAWCRDPKRYLLAGLLLATAIASAMIDHSRAVRGVSPLWIMIWLPAGFAIAELLRQRAELRHR